MSEIVQSEAFKQAVVDSKKLIRRPTNEELLDIYALYKVGTGEDFSKATKPGMMDFKASRSSQSTTPPPYPRKAKTRTRRHSGRGISQGTAANTHQGKAKYNAWKKAVDDGLTAEQAQEKYVAKIEELKGIHGYDPNKEPEAVGGQ
ncbi:hypothetical protein VTJ49DRAFT_6228 [Mycothermus thermophilus]|uniref:ACB domain-containing protein n=1 Tax=Humicola insolens TaxID=85995 RepID=A0ABR3VJN6_HUMIN